METMFEQTQYLPAEQIVNSLETTRLSSEPGLRELDFWKEMQVPDPGAVLSAFPNILSGCGSKANLRKLRRDYPDACSQIEESARAALQHCFDLLGSGNVELGESIDWSLDFKSGKRWDLRERRLQKLINRRDNSDVRIPWELSRCNHFLTMALAYLLTNDHTFAIEFENQVYSWRDANPYEFSLNWTSTSETSYRCLNWLVAYKAFGLQRRFTPEFEREFLTELYKGGRFIRANLDDTGLGENASDRIIDLVGLLYIGELFRNTTYGYEWRRLAIAQLERETASRIDAEGLEYESSLPYHGVISEFLLYAQLLSSRSDFRFSETFAATLIKMLRQLAFFTQRDGTILPFGDCDDSRLFKITARHPRDFRDLIAIGKVQFGDSSGAGTAHAPEELAVFEDSQIAPGGKKANQPLGCSVYFTASGICRLSSNDLTATFFANGVSAGGLGSHKHNDTLSFTLEHHGIPVLIDPGTYTYTADETWRNLFRSAASHNCVTVDDCEPNRMVSGLPFVLRRDSHPLVVRWDSDDDFDLVVAENDGYCRLDDPVIHRRSLFLDKATQVLLLRDELIAQGLHVINYHFQADNIRITLLRDQYLRLQPHADGSGILLANCVPGLSMGISTNWVSPRYGVKHSGLKITASAKVKLPFASLFAFVPDDTGDLVSAGAKIEAARNLIGW